MKVSLSWLKELVDHNLSPKELAEKLSLMSVGVKQTTDDFLELDLTYNRGDLLSMLGVAREVTAITDSKTKFSENTKGYNDSRPRLDVPQLNISVENSNLCPVYCLAKIEKLRVGPSAQNWVKKLADCGVRSVNNIADVTNLIMLEFGQPMHAFDARGVKDETIVVRTAKKGERITTLDGKTRDLETTDLLITDSLNALGIAGIMGGKDSEISDSTTTILLEAAIFDPLSIRQTAQRLSLRSEASKRFQHGLTKTNLLQALSAAIKMYESLGGKLTAISLVGDLEDKTKTVRLTQEKLNSLLGVEIPADHIESSLQSLGFNVGSPLRSNNNILRASEASREVQLSWGITVPYWRLDINIEEDLIEEVARIYGYEKIEGKPLKGELPQKLDQSFYNFLYDLKVSLKNAGLTEVQTYSFYSTDVSSNLGYDKNELIKIANPISSETEYLRNHLWPNLVEVVGKNLRQGYKDIAIFEIGKVYNSTKSGYHEEYKLSIALMNGTDNPLQELTQLSLGVNLGHPPGVQLGERIGESGGRFHPNRYVYLTYKGKSIGKIGEVHPRFLNNFGIEKRVAIVEISLENIIQDA